MEEPQGLPWTQRRGRNAGPAMQTHNFLFLASFSRRAPPPASEICNLKFGFRPQAALRQPRLHRGEAVEGRGRRADYSSSARK